MVGFLLLAILPLLLLDGCLSPLAQSNAPSASDAEQPSLSIMSQVDGPNSEFETKTLGPFVGKQGFQLRYIPSFESVNDRLEIYRQLLRDHSPQPDIFEIDIIWPSILADDLVDLKPYLGADIGAFPPELLKAFTVGGRLVAIPLYMDTSLLYYRADLLKKYGFPRPPETWDELEKMAKVIQSGERRAGKKDFWGYVWQGRAYEGLTCDALEWQISAGGGPILNEDRTVSVCNRNAIGALDRAASWVGTISPPGVVAYDEYDSFNVWQSGNAAFMRHWGYIYASARKESCPVRNCFGVAMLPGGMGGRYRALGGKAVAVSRYSEHRDEAIATLRYLTSAGTQRIRAGQIGSVPTNSLLQQSAAVMEKTPFHGPLAGQVMTDVVARPSVIAGKSYDAVSRAYFEAVHSALTHQANPQEALAKLEKQLVQITGFRAVHKN